MFAVFCLLFAVPILTEAEMRILSWYGKAKTSPQAKCHYFNKVGEVGEVFLYHLAREV